ncbi:hypothetical protein GOBAR_AA10781 [Gossypium barbadense]|uniref:Uncharacterized protein n=1 Tax=Gossypium barbadense TaxID=3634 RepID=A0A2P5Y2R4_GOSBA|nr:hypothetical protein GOBAR_AA10781 [Gossypium barbadense]
MTIARSSSRTKVRRNGKTRTGAVAFLFATFDQAFSFTSPKSKSSLFIAPSTRQSLTYSLRFRLRTIILRCFWALRSGAWERKTLAARVARLTAKRLNVDGARPS